MKYTSRKKINPSDRSEVKYHPTPVYSDKITGNDVAKEISLATSMSPGDVMHVIITLLNILPKYLCRGNRIQLENLGTFKVTFGGKGHAKAEDVSSKDIEHVRISFVAAPELKHAVMDEITFEKVSV